MTTNIKGFATPRQDLSSSIIFTRIGFGPTRYMIKVTSVRRFYNSSSEKIAYTIDLFEETKDPMGRPFWYSVPSEEKRKLLIGLVLFNLLPSDSSIEEA